MKPKHFSPLKVFSELYLLESSGHTSCFFVFPLPPRLCFSLLNVSDDSLKKPHTTGW